MTDWADLAAWDIMEIAQRPDTPPKVRRALIAAKLRAAHNQGCIDAGDAMRVALGVSGLPDAIPLVTTRCVEPTAPEFTDSLPLESAP